MSGYNVKFGATDAGFTSTVSKVKSSLNGLDDNAKRTSKSFGMSFASMAKAGAALAVGFGAIKGAMSAVRGTLDNFKEALDMGGELSDLSARTGETAGNLMVLRRTFDNTGVGADKVGATLNKLQRAIVEAGRGSAVQERAFKELGLSIADLQYMAPIDQMRAVGTALAGVENDGKRTALAMDLLGRSGGELLPLMTNMASEVANAQAELGSLPGVMDKSANAFDAISDKLNVMKGKLTEFAAGLLESAIPALNQFVNAGSTLDSAGFGRDVGQRLSEAFTLITSGDMWEVFKLRGISAIESIRASGVINNLSAAIAATMDAAWNGENMSFRQFKEQFQKYKEYGIEANSEIIDTLDQQLSEIEERQKQRLAESKRQLEKESAEQAAMSGIMLKDIRPKPNSTTNIPEFLKRGPGAAAAIKDSSVDIADNFEKAAISVKSLADSSWEAINAAKEKDRIDPGGRIQNRINEALSKDQFGVAERAANRLDRRVQEERIQEMLGGGGNIKKSLAEIAKQEGIDTKGKSSRELRKELVDRANLKKEMEDAMKKRQSEMKPGEGGKKGDEKPGEAKTKTEDMLLKAVQTIEKLVAKIEPKLPTHALSA